ncbi:hypothetical protein G3R49_05940 [Shewanella sp. WXL01]|uniref:hypothetical protein n=1 Tax=Shewanella sp. WXL01 TaxID=2709721 RepID=UPI0014383506|nr:hypothetical protein [Shewanella sp. WXL01]NKF50110.1 hypothetical protein [Shewanella sp. WXL01]
MNSARTSPVNSKSDVSTSEQTNGARTNLVTSGKPDQLSKQQAQVNSGRTLNTEQRQYKQPISQQQSQAQTRNTTPRDVTSNAAHASNRQQSIDTRTVSVNAQRVEVHVKNLEQLNYLDKQLAQTKSVEVAITQAKPQPTAKLTTQLATQSNAQPNTQNNPNITVQSNSQQSQTNTNSFAQAVVSISGNTLSAELSQSQAKQLHQAGQVVITQAQSKALLTELAKLAVTASSPDSLKLDAIKQAAIAESNQATSAQQTKLASQLILLAQSMQIKMPQALQQLAQQNGVSDTQLANLASRSQGYPLPTSQIQQQQMQFADGPKIQLDSQPRISGGEYLAKIVSHGDKLALQLTKILGSIDVELSPKTQSNITTAEHNDVVIAKLEPAQILGQMLKKLDATPLNAPQNVKQSTGSNSPSSTVNQEATKTAMQPSALTQQTNSPSSATSATSSSTSSPLNSEMAELAKQAAKALTEGKITADSTKLKHSAELLSQSAKSDATSTKPEVVLTKPELAPTKADVARAQAVQLQSGQSKQVLASTIQGDLVSSKGAEASSSKAMTNPGQTGINSTGTASNSASTVQANLDGVKAKETAQQQTIAPNKLASEVKGDSIKSAQADAKALTSQLNAAAQQDKSILGQAPKQVNTKTESAEVMSPLKVLSKALSKAGAMTATEAQPSVKVSLANELLKLLPQLSPKPLTTLAEPKQLQAELMGLASIQLNQPAAHSTPLITGSAITTLFQVLLGVRANNSNTKLSPKLAAHVQKLQQTALSRLATSSGLLAGLDKSNTLESLGQLAQSLNVYQQASGEANQAATWYFALPYIINNKQEQFEGKFEQEQDEQQQKKGWRLQLKFNLSQGAIVFAAHKHGEQFDLKIQASNQSTIDKVANFEQALTQKINDIGFNLNSIKTEVTSIPPTLLPGDHFLVKTLA